MILALLFSIQEFYLSVAQVLFPEKAEFLTSVENQEADEETNDNFKKAEVKTKRYKFDNWLLHLPSGRTFTFLALLSLALTIIRGCGLYMRIDPESSVALILGILDCGQYVITIFALVFGWTLYTAVCESFMSAP